MEIYEPAEDSYFLAKFLEEYLSKNKNNNLDYLDLGTGSGILAKTALKFFDKKNILASDINPSAIKILKKEGFIVVKSDLFKNINQKFDLITFNAPYLPFDKREPKSSQIATTGGKNGDEISVEFVKQAKKHLKPNGKIFLLISSLTPQKNLKKFHPKIVAKTKIPFEELLILEFKNTSPFN